MMHKKVLVIGLGRFGSALTEELSDSGCDLIIIDRSSEAVDPLKSLVGAAFIADATQPGVLENIGAANVDVAVVTSGEDFEATVLCVAHLAELGVRTIFARAANDRQAQVLSAVGATRAIQVENEMGKRLAVHVLNPSAGHLMDYATHFRVVPWVARSPYVGRTLAQAGLREFQINVLGYFRDEEGHSTSKPRMHMPTADYLIRQGDTLLLVGQEDAMERFFASVTT